MVPTEQRRNLARLLYGWQPGHRPQRMCAHNPTLHRVAKSQDRFSHLWGKPKQPENLGHVGPGDPKLAGEFSPGHDFAGIKTSLPLLGKYHGITIEFGRPWELNCLFRQLEDGGKWTAC